MQPDEMKKLIDSYIQAYSSFDIDGMLLHMHEEVSFRNISNGQVSLSTEGISGLRTAAEQAGNIFNSVVKRFQNISSAETPRQYKLTMQASWRLTFRMDQNWRFNRIIRKI
jgi:hypothetical protein